MEDPGLQLAPVVDPGAVTVHVHLARAARTAPVAREHVPRALRHLDVGRPLQEVDLLLPRALQPRVRARAVKRDGVGRLVEEPAEGGIPRVGRTLGGRVARPGRGRPVRKQLASVEDIGLRLVLEVGGRHARAGPVGAAALERARGVHEAVLDRGPGVVDALARERRGGEHRATPVLAHVRGDRARDPLEVGVAHPRARLRRHADAGGRRALVAPVVIGRVRAHVGAANVHVLHGRPAAQRAHHAGDALVVHRLAMVDVDRAALDAHAVDARGALGDAGQRRRGRERGASRLLGVLGIDVRLLDDKVVDVGVHQALEYASGVSGGVVALAMADAAGGGAEDVAYLERGKPVHDLLPCGVGPEAGELAGVVVARRPQQGAARAAAQGHLALGARVGLGAREVDVGGHEHVRGATARDLAVVNGTHNVGQLEVRGHVPPPRGRVVGGELGIAVNAVAHGEVGLPPGLGGPHDVVGVQAHPTLVPRGQLGEDLALVVDAPPHEPGTGRDAHLGLGGQRLRLVGVVERPALVEERLLGQALRPRVGEDVVDGVALPVGVQGRALGPVPGDEPFAVLVDVPGSPSAVVGVVPLEGIAVQLRRHDLLGQPAVPDALGVRARLPRVRAHAVEPDRVGRAVGQLAEHGIARVLRVHLRPGAAKGRPVEVERGAGAAHLLGRVRREAFVGGVHARGKQVRVVVAHVIAGVARGDGPRGREVRDDAGKVGMRDVHADPVVGQHQAGGIVRGVDLTGGVGVVDGDGRLRVADQAAHAPVTVLAGAKGAHHALLDAHEPEVNAALRMAADAAAGSRLGIDFAVEKSAPVALQRATL